MILQTAVREKKNVTKIGPGIAPSEAVASIARLLDEHPAWNRTRLSRELCRRWNWRRPDGLLKDMTCRDLLLKLERAGQIVLPPRQSTPPNALRNRAHPWVAHDTAPIDGALKTLRPLRIELAAPRSAEARLFNGLLAHYHYLGFRSTVGANLRYLIRDRSGRPLACLLFGSAAWRTAPRDAFIGWSPEARAANLAKITNNTRFLILPWVRVPHLASHLLAKIARRLSGDWVDKYGYPVQLLETFVDRARFRGVCYQAANWTRVGQTTGRTRNDRKNQIHAGVKDIYLYPLNQHFREVLGHVDAG